MQEPVVIVGIGEIGSVFARGFLRSGVPVVPVTRHNDIHAAAAHYPRPQVVLVTVGEAALPEVLRNLPTAWRDRLALVQNELLPRDWQTHELNEPTVISVWFEKKPGQDVKVVVPSPVFGQHAEQLTAALDELSIPGYVLNTPEQLLFELVRKNYYILASNICGLKTGGTVSELWSNHEAFVREVLQDINAIQTELTQTTLDHEALIESMVGAFNGDPDHQCMGRSAPARLKRAIDIATELHLSVPVLERIASETT